jgi:hypothetical protein
MTFVGADANLDAVRVGSLPNANCKACGGEIRRREHRVWIRASWHNRTDVLCPHCWRQVCEWARRFALEQLELPI